MKSLFGWRPLTPPDPRRKSRLPLERWADYGASVFLGLGMLQALVGMDKGWLQFAPLALGVLLFGLPHGAIDHLVALGLAGRSMRIAPLSVVLALYLLAVCAVLALWAVLPVAAAFCFLIMTIYHWGKSDVAFERFCRRTTPAFRKPMGDWIHLVLRGLIPIGVPFIAFPEQATAFLTACIHFSAPDSKLDGAFWSQIILLVFALFFLADFWVHIRHFHDPVARRILLENFALTLFFVLVPPLLAIGWYFAGWHGLRHVLRLCSYDSKSATEKVSLGARLSEVARQALPFTLAAVLMLLLLLWWMADRATSPLERAALYLILISALTLPHLMIVEWMDRREGKD
jgi:Brp/Blh family beta-carotene 15,15'-monooxygenase